MISGVHQNRQIAQQEVQPATGTTRLANTIAVGKNPPVALQEIKGNKVPFAGFRTATKVEKGTFGAVQNGRTAIAALAKPSGEMDIKGLLNSLKTVQVHLDRLERLGTIERSDMDNVACSLLAVGVEELSNKEILSLYQNTLSKDFSELKDSLMYAVRINPDNTDAKGYMANIMNLEALVLQETGNRMARGMYPEETQGKAILALTESHSSVLTPRVDMHKHEDDFDMTNRSLSIVAQASTRGAIDETRISQEVDIIAENKSLNAEERKGLGDVLRSAPLSINVSGDFFLKKDGPLSSLGSPWENIFHLRDKAQTPEQLAEVYEVKGAGYFRKREAIENVVFPTFKNGQEVMVKERPTYAALNIRHLDGGACDTYGAVALHLKDSTSRRATYTVNDTFYGTAISVTEQKKTDFYNLVAQSPLLTTEAKEQLADHNSPKYASMHRTIDGLPLDKELDTDTIMLLDSVFGDSDDSRTLTSLAVQVFGNSEKTQVKMVDRDHIEELLPQLNASNDFLNIAYATSQENLAGARLTGCNYIEAQIHGELSLLDDVEEIVFNPNMMFNVRGDRMSLQSYKEGQWLDAVMKTLSGTSLSRAERHNLDDEQLATLKAMKTALNGRTIPCRITGGIQDDGGFSKVMDYSRGHYDRSLVRNLESGFADKKDLGDFIRLNYVEAERLFAANLLTDEQSESINIAIMDAAKNFENTAISKTALNSDALKYIAESAVQSIIPKDTVTLLHDLKYKISPDEMLASKDAIFASRTTSGKKFMLGEALTKSITSHMQSVQNGSMTAQNLCTLAYEAIQNTTKEFASLSSSARKSDIGLATLIEDAFTDAMARASGSEEEKQAFMDAMHSPEMNGFAHTMASLSNAQTGLANTHDFAALGMMNTALTTMRNVEGQEAPAVQSGQGATQSQAVPSPVHPHLITVENRAILATIMPAIAEKVDKAYPFFPLFPTAHNPDALPKNLAGRKAFLASMLPIYHAHERPASAPDGESDGVQEGYDRGTGYHGRGHICRAFVGAEVMANIMEKRGHTVDRAALAMGIAGHDSGRTNNGTDVEEHKSAAKTIESANAFVGAANLGADYTNEIGRCIDAHQSKTLEGHLLNAADSLDISRVKDFNFHYLSFLRGGTADGVTVEVPEDQALRVQLQKEVLQLAILTDPLVAMRPEIHEANMKFVMHSDNMAYLAAYREMVDAAQKMVCAVQDLEDLDIIARTDAAIQRYPHLFPLMTEHYLHQESV